MEQRLPSPSVGRYPNAAVDASAKQIAHENEAYSSGLSWAAVIGGAFVTAALSLILLALSAGFGFSSVSPWSNVGASASTVGKAAIVWLILMEIISSSMGGYLAGRLRTKWANIHTDEVYFRDTAHGFLAWAVALVVTAAFLASAGATMAGSTVSMTAGGAEMNTGLGPAGRGVGPNAYYLDILLRSDSVKPDSSDPIVRREAGRILENALQRGGIPLADKSYLAQVVASRTGVSQNEAEKRVSVAFESIQEAADAARKAVAHSLLWGFLALLIGAFCASFAATIGGRQRDQVVLV